VELKRVKNAVKSALHKGLHVNVGHGLNYENVNKIAALNGLRGLYIGHSIISRSIYVGMERAVREMKKLIKEAGKR
jgi:pyridoxine 5-phosphate synthase